MDPVERIPLNCPKFDRLLGGGVEKGCVTMFYGEAGAGKTNVCLQAARAAIAAGGRVLYLDSEGLSAERLGQVFEGMDGWGKSFLESQIHGFEHQTELIEKADKLVDANGIPVVIVDSLTMFYRLRYDEQKVRNELVRQTEMLLEIARNHKAAVIVTSQVYSNISSGRVEFLGGHALSHNAKTIVRLEKLDNGRRKAVIVKHRSLPEGRGSYYRIVQNGIEDA